MPKSALHEIFYLDTENVLLNALIEMKAKMVIAVGQ